MVDGSDLVDAQVEQKHGASTPSPGKSENVLDSPIPDLDGRARYAHLPMVPVYEFFQTPHLVATKCSAMASKVSHPKRSSFGQPIQDGYSSGGP